MAVVLADVTTIGLTLGLIDPEYRKYIGIGIVGYLAGAPLVHLLHGNKSNAAISLGMRLLAGTLVFGLEKGLLQLGEGDDTGGTALLFLASAGAVVVGTLAIDSKFLANKTVRRDVVTWMPTVKVDDHAASVGIAGSW